MTVSFTEAGSRGALTEVVLTLIGAPPAGRRIIVAISVHNEDTVNATVTAYVRAVGGTSSYRLFRKTVKPGYTLVWDTPVILATGEELAAGLDATPTLTSPTYFTAYGDAA